MLISNRSILYINLVNDLIDKVGVVVVDGFVSNLLQEKVIAYGNFGPTLEMPQGYL